MSNLARTPESYAAWQRIKTNHVLHPEPWAAMEKCSNDVDFLADGMRYPCHLNRHPLIHFRPVDLTDMLESPTLERLEAFFKRGFELSQLAEQSVARSVQSFRDEELCRADLQAAQEENCRLEAENQRLIEYVRKKSIVVAQKRALLAKMQQQYADNERLISSFGIPVRRDSEGHPICECDQCGTRE